MSYYMKILVFMFISIFLLMPFAGAEGDDITPSAQVHVIVLNDTTVLVSEQIVKHIDADVDSIDRNIQLSDNQSITNVSVETPGYYNEVLLNESEGNYQIKVLIFEDEAHTHKANDTNIEIIYHYNFNKVVKVHNDIVELNMNIWDNNRALNVRNLETIITIPGSCVDAECFNNPSDYVTNSTWYNDTVVTQLSDIPQDFYFRQQLIMPREYFDSFDNALITNIDAKDNIIQSHQDYIDNNSLVLVLDVILDVIMILLMLMPVAIYLYYGREPNIDYDKRYEIRPPSDDSPLYVNCAAVSDVGSFDIYAFEYVLVNLIDRGYYDIVSCKIDDDVVIKRSDKALNNLQDYEIKLIEQLNDYEFKGEVNFYFLYDEYPEDFRDFIKQWNPLLNSQIDQKQVNKLFDNNGSRMMKLFSKILIFSGIIIILSNYLTHSISNTIFIAFLMLIVGLIAHFMPNTVGGRWTNDGRLYHEKWKNFKKYLENYDLIEQYPPESLDMWAKDLYYATALGCAREFSENMIKYFKQKGFSEDYINTSVIVYFAYNGGFKHIRSFEYLRNASSKRNSR